MDLDHTIPYTTPDPAPDTGGPPGQTRIGNLGKLTRFEHRVKTHALGWRHRQPRPGIHHWRTPTGHTFTVTPSGTFQHGRQDTPQTAHERAFERLITS